MKTLKGKAAVFTHHICLQAGGGLDDDDLWPQDSRHSHPFSPALSFPELIQRNTIQPAVLQWNSCSVVSNLL